MKKRIALLLILTLTLALCFGTQGTFAWFSDTVVNQQDFEIGNVHYIYSGTLQSSDTNAIVVPGQPLITGSTLYLTNQSDIDTNLRVRIQFSYTSQTTGQPVTEAYSDDPNDVLNQFLNLSLVDGWTYDSSDECWHFHYSGSETIPATTTQDGYSFAIINGLQFDGAQVDNSLSGAVFHIKLIFQAKQAGFVDWQTLGTGDISALAAG